MKNYLTLFCLLAFFSQSINAFTQDKYDQSYYLIDSIDFSYANEKDLILIDSTLSQYHKTKSDTAKLDLLNNIIDNCYNDNIWPAYNEVMKKNSKRLLSDPRNINYYWNFKIVSTYALSISNEGYLAYFQGNIENALNKYQTSLKIREQIKDSLGISQSLNNIGGVFYSTNNLEKSIEYFKRSLRIKEKHADPQTLATTLNNIGSLYNKTKELDSAEHYFNRCLKIYEKEDDIGGLAFSYHNIASVNSNRGHYGLAKLFYLKSIRLSESLGDSLMIANSYYQLGQMYLEKGEYANAEKYGLRSLKNAQQLGYPAETRDAADLLRFTYRRMGKYKRALEMYDIYIQMKDSTMTAQAKQDIENQQLTYEFEKKALTDSLKHAEENKINNALISEQQAKIDRDKLLNYSLLIGLLLLLIIIAIIIVSLRNIRKAKEVIANQKTEVEKQHEITKDQREKLAAKNTEILDSINYAKRLQEGILPSQNTINLLLPNNFLLYLPKDIVAGDFYWVEKAGNTNYFAVADCTGHGVPGAFVSIICANALNNSILELDEPNPAEILEHVTNSVIESFNKSNHQIKDGMDIAICAFNTKTNTLQYAGAYNPLWVITQKESINVKTKIFSINSSKYLHEIKGTKQPVGKYSFKKDFELHEIQVEKGDQIYLTSDGYPDQFGGEKGKKLKYKNLKTILLQNSNLALAEQGKKLKEYFHFWKGDFEQVDDVCVIGVKV